MQHKLTVYVVSCATPDDTSPIRPETFTSRAVAEQWLESMLFDQWAERMPDDDYPGNWLAAMTVLSSYEKDPDARYGRWEITEHEIVVPDTVPAPDDREMATILAALRYWQMEIEEEGEAFEYGVHFDEHEPLTPAEIDALCERLN